MSLLPPLSCRVNSSAASPRFSTTSWTLILKAGADGPQRGAAMEQFCKAYWYPVFAFIRRRGLSPEDAQDSTQAFFTKLIERNWLASVERREARFSTWLLSLVKSHLMNEYRDTNAQKRGGHNAPMSIELAQAEEWFGAEPITTETPERCFERRWALTVLNCALKHLRSQCVAAGKSNLFAKLSPFLSREPELGEYTAIAAELNIRENSVAVAVHRLRERFRDAVRNEVAAGLTDATRIKEEMQHLALSL